MVQRLQRGGRLDVTNPMKKNHLFIWCDDWTKTINSLQLLKNSDPEFHKKIRVIDSNYDKSYNKDTKEKELEKSIEFKKYIEVKCLSLDELWEKRRQEWIVQFNKLGRKPNTKSINIDELRAARWQSVMRTEKRLNKPRMTINKIKILSETPNWEWDEKDTFMEQLNNYILQFNKNGREPVTRSNDDNEKRAAYWKSDIRKAKDYKDGIQILSRARKLTDEQLTILNNTKCWSWDRIKTRRTFKDQLDNWINVYNKNKILPKFQKKDKIEST